MQCKSKCFGSDFNLANIVFEHNSIGLGKSLKSAQSSEQTHVTFLECRFKDTGSRKENDLKPELLGNALSFLKAQFDVFYTPTPRCNGL